MKDRRGFAIWLTGLPASGKSTLAALLEKELIRLGMRVQILDSDELRRVLTPQPEYSQGERDWFYSVMIFIGQLLVKHGVNVIFAATAHRRLFRDEARQSFTRFIEVYVRCPLKVCMKRDQKGIFEKALAGEANHVPGLQELYETPTHPELIVDTEKQTPDESIQKIVSWLRAQNLIQGAQPSSLGNNPTA